MGQQLSQRIEGRISEMVEAGGDRADIVRRISSGAGVNEDTVNAIIRGSIERPPDNRLGAFARVLDISVETLRDLRDADVKSQRLPEWDHVLGGH